MRHIERSRSPRDTTARGQQHHVLTELAAIVAGWTSEPLFRRYQAADSVPRQTIAGSRDYGKEWLDYLND